MRRNFITTNSKAELKQFTGIVYLYDEDGYKDFKRVEVRPTTTAADKIAAAAPRGQVCDNEFITIKDDSGGKLDAKGEKHQACGMCRPTEPKQYWKNWQIFWDTELDIHNTTWDPTIRL